MKSRANWDTLTGHEEESQKNRGEKAACPMDGEQKPDGTKVGRSLGPSVSSLAQKEAPFTRYRSIRTHTPTLPHPHVQNYKKGRRKTRESSDNILCPLCHLVKKERERGRRGDERKGKEKEKRKQKVREAPEAPVLMAHVSLATAIRITRCMSKQK